MTTIKERRYKIRLYAADDNQFNLSDDKEALCELQSFRASFSLNSIPQAVAKPAFGTIINGSESKSTTFEKLFELCKNRAAVIVKLQVTHSFTSDTNSADTEFWDFTDEVKTNSYGEYHNKNITIFEGYLSPPAVEVSPNSANCVLTINHWISAIAGISLITTACHTSYPMELSAKNYFIDSDKNAINSWGGQLVISEGTEASKFFKKYPTGLWEKGIYKMFQHFIKQADTTETKFIIKEDKEEDGEGIYNDFSEKEQAKIAFALKRIDGKALYIRDKVTELGFAICQFIQNECYNGSSYIQISAWDKLIRVFSPTFLFSIVPRIKNVLLIPSPCTINKKKVIDLKEDELLQLSSSPLAKSQLSRLVCCGSLGDPGMGGTNPQIGLTEITTYPPLTKNKERDGFVQAIAYPQWLNTVQIVKPPEDFFGSSVFLKKEQLKESYTRAVKNGETVQKNTETRNLICDEFTKYAFVVQSLSGTWANVVTPFRMDICPGASVHAVINEKENGMRSDTKTEVYGTVTTVSFSISSGRSTPTTQLSLTNIRTAETIDDDIENPQGEIGFYTSQWDGTKEKLYD